jgi:hypothetical protein
LKILTDNPNFPFGNNTLVRYCDEKTLQMKRVRAI